MLFAVTGGTVINSFFWQLLVISVLIWRTKVAIRIYANRPVSDTEGLAIRQPRL